MKKLIIFFCLFVCSVLGNPPNPPNIDGDSNKLNALLFSIFDSNYAVNNKSDDEIFASKNIDEPKAALDWALVKSVITHSTTPNVFMSPFAVKLMLTVLFEASDEGTPTRRQLDKVNPINYKYAFDEYEFRDVYSKGIASIRKNSYSYNVDFGTRIFVDNSVEPKSRLTSVTEKYYSTAFERTNFNDTTKAAELINDWCARTTKNNIPAIVDDKDSLTSSLVVLLNVAHFQGLWSHSFTNEVITGKFISPVGLVNATYMRTKGRFYFYNSEALDAKVVRLPYAGKKFAMFVVLPNNKKGLQHLISELDTVNFNRALWNMDATEVKLLLPKFKIDFSMNINEVIKGVGINKVFAKEASLSALAVPGDETFQEGAPVSSIFHAAGISVDEKSAEVEAHEPLPVVESSNSTKEIKFEAAWPFLFFIQDETTGAVLFAGTVNKPEV